MSHTVKSSESSGSNNAGPRDRRQAPKGPTTPKAGNKEKTTADMKKQIAAMEERIRLLEKRPVELRLRNDRWKSEISVVREAKMANEVTVVEPGEQVKCKGAVQGAESGRPKATKQVQFASEVEEIPYDIITKLQSL